MVICARFAIVRHLPSGLINTHTFRTYLCSFQMVLPDGTHVRFGPEEWEEAPGYIYPKTTKVNGYCNEKPEAEENEWVWKVRSA